MRSFYDKDDYTIEDIQSLIDNQVEESIYLDFKSAGSLEKIDKKRMELSKDVASFANSDGGIIVYGIKEVNHVAAEFSFIDGNEFTKEWIEQVISSYVQRRIADVTIYPIRIDGDMKKSIYIVKIPYSYDAPHLSKDNRYYKRYNFISVPMEEYEVRMSYGRKRKAKLGIEGYQIRVQSDATTVTAVLDIDIYNEGSVVETAYKLNAYFTGSHENVSYNWSSQNTTNYTLWQNRGVKISSVCREPIYPNETINVMRLDLVIRRGNVKQDLQTLKMELRLLYGESELIMKYDLNDLKEALSNFV
ncbi:ATP-binding protein [Pedobacter sp. MR2016-19]|uniref:AlbA family DNA-binding domain-containing protein n=1 Tax=Pedobacter sp. MR2016-19 TaxID=2780089 RepID=UPI0018735152|nr:ATP-binding protein [Pedobacter sp. MR2016-19]MBE5321495.1 ATP-binding protein [Pedobacter sp. MR2016-19]